MGFFDRFKSKKKKGETAPAGETEVLRGLEDVDLSGIEPPETRYTQEYQDFLASQEGSGECGGSSEAESGEDGTL